MISRPVKATNNYFYSTVSSENILSFMQTVDNIDLDDVTKRMKEFRREKILTEIHPYKITASRDGRYRTYIKDTTKSSGRRQIVRVRKEDLEEFLIKHYEEVLNPNASITMSSLYQDWLKYKSLHVEQSTIERVKCDWNRYYRDAEIVNKPIQQLTKLELDEWVHTVIKKHQMTKHQYNNFRSIVLQELDYAVDREIITANPFLEVKVNLREVLRKEKKKPDETQVYSKDEYRAIKDIAWQDFYSKNNRVNRLVPLAVMFMFLTGLRVSEVCAIKYEDVTGNRLTVCRMFRHSTKEIVDDTKGAFGDRNVPLTADALALIDTARACQREIGVCDDGYIFATTDKFISLYSSVRKAFYRYCDALGIPRKGSHKARKTFISALLDDRMNINRVRQIAGHMDERTTLNNYCYDRSTDDEILTHLNHALS